MDNMNEKEWASVVIELYPRIDSYAICLAVFGNLVKDKYVHDLLWISCTPHTLPNIEIGRPKYVYKPEIERMEPDLMMGLVDEFFTTIEDRCGENSDICALRQLIDSGQLDMTITGYLISHITGKFTEYSQRYSKETPDKYCDIHTLTWADIDKLDPFSSWWGIMQIRDELGDAELFYDFRGSRKKADEYFDDVVQQIRTKYFQPRLKAYDISEIRDILKTAAHVGQTETYDQLMSAWKDHPPGVRMALFCLKGKYDGGKAIGMFKGDLERMKMFHE
jgi:hypothetical protein